MSRNVKLPDAVYDRIEEAASASGHSVVEVISARFPVSSATTPRGVEPSPVASSASADATTDANHRPPRSLADLFEGLIGVVSLDVTDLSERTGELFGEGMVQKHREGCL
jgi:hypothetical protein